MHSPPAGSLKQAWERGNTKERSDLVTLITSALQYIDEEVAQKLPHKDCEAIGWYDRISTFFEERVAKLSMKLRRPDEGAASTTASLV